MYLSAYSTVQNQKNNLNKPNGDLSVSDTMYLPSCWQFVNNVSNFTNNNNNNNMDTSFMFFWHMSITHRCLTWCISVSLCRRLSYCTKPKNNLDKPPDVSNMSSNDMIYLLVCRQCIGSISNCTKPNNWFDMPSGVSNTCQCWGMYLLDLGGVSVHPRSLLYWV